MLTDFRVGSGVQNDSKNQEFQLRILKYQVRAIARSENSNNDFKFILIVLTLVYVEQLQKRPEIRHQLSPSRIVQPKRSNLQKKPNSPN